MKRRSLLFSVALNLAFLVGLLAVVKMKGGFGYLWTKTSSMIRGQGFHRDYNPHYFNRKELFERLPTEADDILFIGDSLVQHCEWADLFKDANVRNRGILGDTVLGVLHRIEDHLKPIAPRKIYLMIGINDLFLGVPENRIMANYGDILRQIRSFAPDCSVIVQGILPIDDRSAPKPVASAVIRSLNAGLKKLCGKHDITYLDSFETFDQDGDGRLDERFSRDGLHLNAKGYFTLKQLLDAEVNVNR